MLIVQQKVKYHPPIELNTSKKKTNAEQTIKTNQQTNKQNRAKKKKGKQKIPSTNLWGLLVMVLDSSMLCKLFLLDLSAAINL
jgi:hypothetical protein